MKLGIGIDTGGTYTDAVVYNFDNKKVEAFTKTLTTKEDLSVGISNALDNLPKKLLEKAEILSLSTTLATNACVENKGGRAKLILIGYKAETLQWIDAKSKYGIDYSDILCLENECSFDGRVVNHPNWEEVISRENEWLTDAQALSLSATYATRNGAVCEKTAKAILNKSFDIPLITASEVADDLNVLERGVTAQLNAKLLPVIKDFNDAVKKSLINRNLNLKTVIVRSDGSLMKSSHAMTYPVNTILSGPSASVVGGRGLCSKKDCIIIDIGGTTTDIAIVKDNEPVMTDKINIGGFLTQVKGVYIDTFGLGGDSRIFLDSGRIHLHSRRVLPLCVAATRFPCIIPTLKKLVESETASLIALHEFYYLLKMPTDLERYNQTEIDFIESLKNNQNILSLTRTDNYGAKYERLENEGIIIRCGLTPTDIMHIKGDYTAFNSEASILAVRFLLQRMPDYLDDEISISKFSDEVYEIICKKLYCNIARVLLMNKFPNEFEKDLPDSLINIINHRWEELKSGETPYFNFDISTKATLVGIGAPTHLFIEKVATALGTDFIIPEHASVANAVGAVIADVSAKSKISISSALGKNDKECYIISSVNERIEFKTLESAIQEATKLATKHALDDAKSRGAIGELQVKQEVVRHSADSTYGSTVNLGATIIVSATGRI